jgi:hypothetical protein
VCHMNNNKKTIRIPLSDYDVDELFRELMDGNRDEIHWGFNPEGSQELINVIFVRGEDDE